MNDLNFFYENPPEFAGFIPRKRGIDSPKTIIYGVLNSGKSAVLKNEISELKKDEILYLNLADLRLEEAVANDGIFVARNSADNTKASEANENEISGEATLDAEISDTGEFYCAAIKNTDTKNEAEVVALGKGEKLEGIKVGDKVIFNKFSGNEIEDGDIKYLIVNADDILAVIE